MSILIKGIPLGGYEISIMKDGERYRARVDGIWCEVEEIPTTDTDSDTISRQAAIEALYHVDEYNGRSVEAIRKLPPAQLSTNLAEVGTDCISRQQAIDALHMHLMYRMGTDSNKKRLDDWINGVPSVQPEQRTCVNCGRTVNNGGWYADGRTRCPIEEHYALPKDGYCHLWEKRNVTDDDYPERREE
jgi:hypothetical protein